MGSYILINDIKIKDIHFAITKKEKEYGLMFEKEPYILVFLYKTPDIRKFWMKNCLVPLDIVFVKNNNIFSILKGNPNSENLIGPNVPCDYVIEFPFSYCKNNNIQIGDYIRLKLSKKILSKLLK